jgi:hypothetical protein
MSQSNDIPITEGEQDAILFAELDADTDATRRLAFSTPNSHPPFFGPIGPTDDAFLTNARLTAIRSETCVNASYAAGEFIRSDVIEGFVYRTVVSRDGTVTTFIYNRTPVPEIGPGDRLVFYVRRFDNTDPMASYNTIVAEYNAHGIGEYTGYPVVQVLGQGSYCRWHFDEDIGLHWWINDSPDRAEIHHGVISGTVPKPKPVKPDKDREIRLDRRGMIKFAVRLANVGNGRCRPSADDRLGADLQQLLDVLRREVPYIRRHQFARIVSPYSSKALEFEGSAAEAIDSLFRQLKTTRDSFRSYQCRRDDDARPKIDPHDMRMQLEALTREFGEVTVNYFRRKVSVVTQPIAIVDPEFKVSVEFGPFRISYNYELIGEPSPDAFTAYALTPVRNLDFDKSRRLVHPHVEDGSICMGSAFNPVLILLKQARLFEAFLVVHTLLVNYGEQAAPFAAPWSWHFTPAEAHRRRKEMAQARVAAAGTVQVVSQPYDADECESDEDEDEDEERCEDCDNSIDDCTCSECTNCGASYNYEDSGGRCDDCGDVFCDDHIQTCSTCDRLCCHGCSRSCDRCGNDHLCENCRTSCGQCDATLCESCLTRCHECGTAHCAGCLTACENCNERFCSECYNAHSDQNHSEPVL